MWLFLILGFIVVLAVLLLLLCFGSRVSDSSTVGLITPPTIGVQVMVKKPSRKRTTTKG